MSVEHLLMIYRTYEQAGRPDEIRSIVARREGRAARERILLSLDSLPPAA